MAGPAAARRGQPLLALGLLLVGWFTVRAVTWVGYPHDGASVAEASGGLPSSQAQLVAKATVVETPSAASVAIPQPSHRSLAKAAPRQSGAAPVLAPVFQTAWGTAMPRFSLDRETTGRRPTGTAQADPQEFYEPVVEKDDPRWSGENWLLMRAGSGAAAQAPGAASYGASQAGAIVRYRFGKGEPQDAYGYLRTSLAINAPGKDKELALGFGVRPVRRLPVRVLMEARLQDTSRSSMRVRPVATVITEIPWQRLPRGFRLEAYGQAGYAGGQYATPFFDAQALIDHPVRGLVPRNNDLRAGIGTWSGGQEGAVRLDIGPRVAFRLEGGQLIGPTRVALDWRFRVAGNARPGSGPTMTVTSAF